MLKVTANRCFQLTPIFCKNLNERRIVFKFIICASKHVYPSFYSQKRLKLGLH